MYKIDTNEGYFLHLLKCALKSEQPMEAPDGIDFKKILELSIRQDVQALIFLSIDKLDNKKEILIYDELLEFYYKAQKHCVFQDMALEELVQAFTAKGIDCMPLKGSVIKNYYPAPELRAMGDIDFLVREQNRQVVRDIMHSLGYDDDLLDDGQVDAFKRGKLDYIEVHYDFSAENHVYHEIFTIDWDKLEQTDTPHLFKQTFEDLYFFNVGHYAKNMHNKGMGIKGVVDGYVLWKCISDEQKQQLQNRFAEIQLADFHNALLKIADIWFNDVMDDGTLDDVQEYLMKMKTYGSHQVGMTLNAMFDNQSSSNTKFVLRKIFPTPDELYKRFDIKERCFLLLPFLWLKRIFIQLFGNKEKWAKAKDQLDVFNEINQDDIDYERNVRKQFGLM